MPTNVGGRNMDTTMEKWSKSGIGVFIGFPHTEGKPYRNSLEITPFMVLIS